MTPNPIAQGLKELKDIETEASLRSKALALANNPNAAPGLTTTVAMLEAAAELISQKLAAKVAAEAEATAATESKNAAVLAGKVLLDDYGNEAWKATGKNVQTVKLLNFRVREEGSPTPPPNDGQMMGLTLKAGTNPGSLILKAKPMPRKVAIDIQVNTTPNATPTWVNEAPFSSTPHTLTGLTSGSMVQVRIRAVFANAVLGPWSDIAEMRVP